MSLTPLRVLVADDSPTVRNRIKESLAGHPGFEVAGEAEDGHSAFEECCRLRPHVVILDMMMAGSTGLDATRRIMARCPTPILIVSASAERGGLLKTLDALDAGAVDVLDKPRPGLEDGQWENLLVQKLRRVARVRVITHLDGRREARAEEVAPRKRGEFRPQPAFPRRGVELVALGASTGGPRALRRILSGLAGFERPILIVLHLGSPFDLALPGWLAGQIPLPVAEAHHGQLLDFHRGSVLFAPPDRHMVVRGDRIELVDAPEHHSCRPSVDLLFESMAQGAAPSKIAAGVLTGMGRDGAMGLAALRRAGAVTFAQDRATSTVFGMPAAAFELGGAEHELPLDAISSFLQEVCRHE